MLVSGSSAVLHSTGSAYVGLNNGSTGTLTLAHGGGYPGYGSHVMLMPDTGTGVFALANRTYAGPSGPAWDTA
eukprot:gene18448-22579_t